jgi:hypothetical protein
MTKGRAVRLPVAAAVAVLALAACSDPATPTQGTPPASPVSPPGQWTPAAPEPPDGFRWVGVDELVVAVPVAWETQIEPCAPPDGDVVHFVGRASAQLDCETVPTRGVSSLSIAPAGSGGAIPLGRSVDLGIEIDGTHVTTSDVTCRTSSVGPCSLTFLAAGTAFRVHYRGPEPQAFVAAVRDSLTRLPAGLTTVPFFDYGTAVDDAQQQLSTVGLEGRSPEVDWPHYATGTEPVAGSVVPEGSTVDLRIGDG